MVDTNVLISAALSPKGTPRRVVEWIIGHGVLLSSKETAEEFVTRFLPRAKFDRYLSSELRAQFIVATLGAAEVVETTSRVSVCADPDDDRFVELAVDAAADYLITGNRRDFPERYERFEIVTPREFAEAVGLT